MNKTSTKYLFLLLTLTLISFKSALAQTITVGNVNPGPYGQGSTIVVPININDAGGCINQGNTFNIYLSDASGNFPAGGTLIGSYSGFYTGFVNGVIPNGTTPGTNYKVRVQSTSPATTSATSAAFTINNKGAVTASVSSQTINSTNTNVFGRCIGLNNAPFTITNTSAPGTTVTASFYNELTKAYEGTNVPIPAGGYTFTASTSNYTVTVKTVDASGTVGTYGYQLINNLIRSNIGSTGNGFVCLSNGKGDLSFNIDISSLAGGIQVNYPGNVYVLDWGDGTSTTYTFCQLKALNGIVTHTFTLPSCGKTGNGVANSFYVSNQPESPYCGQVNAPPGVSAKVLIVPTTKFTAPAIACAGSALTIPNTSQPGPDPNNTVTPTCDNNPGTLYDWYLDGVPVAGYQGVPLATSLVLPTTIAHGTHTVLLHTELGGGYCPSTDYSQTICFENPPKPAFTIPKEICITSGAVTPVNTSVTDATCSVPKYTWTVTGPAGVTYTGGTNANSQIPQFVFTAGGVYNVQLAISSGGCGQITTQQTILVDTAPVATLAPDATICGNNLTLSFDPTQTITKTILSGTAQKQATTYTWTVTGGAYTFTGGTNANSKNPKIIFSDFATYTISITHQNSCGTVTATQKLTFVQAPTVNAGPDQTVCASAPAATLAGSITGTYTSFQWVGGNGTFSPSRNVLTPTYTPTNAEITAGNVTLTLQATTTLPAPCNIVTNAVTINITPTAMITSPPSVAVCSGQPLNYTITANYPDATFTWTATLASGTATGFTTSGTGSAINDLISNTGGTDAVVKYSILPTLNGCPGTPFTLTATIHPLPIITAAPANSPNCSNQPANIVFTSNVANTTYTWTSTAGAGISGNSTQSTPLATNSIQDILVNTGTTPATVTYIVTPYNGTCSGPPVTTSITIQPPPIPAHAGPDDEVCNVGTYTLKGNSPAPGTGKWTEIQGPAGVTFSDATDPSATANGLIPGNVYQFQWTITSSPGCPTSSSVVNITVDKPPLGGTTGSDATVCSGSNGGQVTLTGYFGTIVRWESSVDNGATWQPIANTATVLSYSNLNQTTQYRAIVQNTSLCGDVPSTVTTITVGALPIASMPGPDDVVCNVTVYNLHANNPSPGTGKWTVASGPPGATFSDDTDPNAVVSGLIPGSVYQFKWTITGSPSCPTNSNVVNITIEKAPVGGTTTANPATVCAGSNNGQITLSGQFGTIIRWEFSIDNGTTWQPIANTTPTLSYTNLTQTTEYRAILQNGTTCGNASSTVAIITVNPPPVASMPGQDDEVCNVTSYTLHGNNPAPATGKWTVVSGPPGATFSDDTNPIATVSGLVPGNVYQFRWTITGALGCSPNTNVVNITIDKAPIGGTTSTNATVCSGGNNGTITLTGYFGTIVRWESSIDNGATWQAIPNNGTTQVYLNLTQTTEYRAILQNTALCGEVPSTPTTITVNPVTPIADAGKDYNICNETTITLNGNNPGNFQGVWTQTAGPTVTIANPTSYQTQVTGLAKGNVYTFQWTIKGLPPCSDTQSSITIGAYADVIPSFTMSPDHSCGPITVAFTNTSTPAPTGTFVWDFGDGTPAVTATNPPPHVFQPSADGSEITYKITLTPTSNCNVQAPYVAFVKVSPAVPVAKMLPNQTSACGNFTLTAKNLSPGNNVQYDFYLKNANGTVVQHLTYQDTRDATFQPINPSVATNYTVYVVATDKCGNQGSSPPIIISLAPSGLVSGIQLKDDVESVCLGNPITFQNISTGGDRFIVTIYDAAKNPLLTMPMGTGDLNYTPTAVGTYFLSIVAGNDGCGDAPASDQKAFFVYPNPEPGFTYSASQNYGVIFNNTTPNAGQIPAPSLSYKWDFGDGTTDNSYNPPEHKYDFSKSPFTVTLTATTPGTTCMAMVKQIIDIQFHGNLFIPNAFIPTSNNPGVNIFMAKGSGLKTWKMQIFNNFGQLVWESTKLDANGSPIEGWDGTYKGQLVQQGVYIWQISATLLNGEEWKGMSYNNSPPSHTGPIHLIR